MIELIDEITQKNNGLFPLIDANKIKGGLYSVETEKERDNIPLQRIKEGMLCYVNSTLKYFTFKNGVWVKASLGGIDGSIPILDKQSLDVLTLSNSLPQKYITIADKEDDLKGSNISREISRDGTYVDILFSAIRKLLSEVSRLRNSFKYGIYSYTGTDTAMSAITNEINLVDDEPLWAIDEDDLSLISDAIESNLLEPAENYIAEDLTVNINTLVEFISKDVLENEDVKLLTYITSDSLDLKFNFTSEESEINLSLRALTSISASLYNALIILNSNPSYIWVTIDNSVTDRKLAEGYYYGGKLYEERQELNNVYHLNKITLGSLKLTKLKVYSKYQDFTNSVNPTKPSDEDYKYRVAHLTIRSVKTKSLLDSIKILLPNNELIWVEDSKKLFIKSKDNLVPIGGGSSIDSDTGMTETELIEKLTEMGIVRNDGQDLQINDISDMTFIHEDSGKLFKFLVDGSGLLYSQELPNESKLFSKRISANELSSNVRGFIGLLRIAENNKDSSKSKILVSNDAKLCSDRLKIGAFYAPLSTDVAHGCTHCYVELENTADQDYPLQGCYLHFVKPGKDAPKVYHLALTGTIPAGGTYLIRGKQFAETAYLNVSTFDQEWYADKEPISFEVDMSLDYTNELNGYGFALTYGESNLSYSTQLWHDSKQGNELTSLGLENAQSTYPYILSPSLIDSIYYYSPIQNKSVNYWAGGNTVAIVSNSIYKNTFELDPAKLAFQAFNTSDSSRARWDKAKNDYLILLLKDETIKFPHSEDEYPISKFTPKASFEHKNVCSDKSKLDYERPNMVTCSFGIDIYKTRCFNWISAGTHDEFVWIRKKGDSSWNKFESYKSGTNPTLASTYPRRVEFTTEIKKAVYDRIIGTFPADGTQYTAHKCIVNVVDLNPSSPTVYEYVVGLQLPNGKIDSNRSSDIYTFTLYPTTYTPRIYLTSDLQGFHWIEYQAWAAAANALNEKINKDLEKENIIPILVNTGDMTQNGTRINEWYDYYQAGRNLFNHLEQMNVVGNNDLCGNDFNVLGTGDDNGKANSFYFHVFYCYEINPSIFTPIVNGKYIPSLYYFDSLKYRYVFVNSEITMKNCIGWYNLSDGDKAINIYTGFSLADGSYKATNFTPIYTMLFDIFKDAKDKSIIAACHEMPFTVTTNDALTDNSLKKVDWRSINSSKLIGSHLNLIDISDTSKGVYWFSRLLEFFKVKLCIGGHKHTYAITYPLREYFFWDSLAKNSKDNYSEYSMSRTLENDNVVFISGGINYTKLPLTKRDKIVDSSGIEITPSGQFYPYTPVPNLEGGVTYFMCQATGYKLTSNKELPSAIQKYSMLIPQTTIKNEKDTAAKAQQFPMFGIIDCNTKIQVKLARVVNILSDASTFTLTSYGTSPMQLQYLGYMTWDASTKSWTSTVAKDYGSWGDSETNVLSL